MTEISVSEFQKATLGLFRDCFADHQKWLRLGVGGWDTSEPSAHLVENRAKKIRRPARKFVSRRRLMLGPWPGCGHWTQQEPAPEVNAVTGLNPD
ncbi:pimeloyl-ACP methyl ester carboxylesterase [Bradyrhizobium sp. USDA 4472]